MKLDNAIAGESGETTLDGFIGFIPMAQVPFTSRIRLRPGMTPEIPVS